MVETSYTIITPYESTYNLIDDNKMIYIGSKYYCLSVGNNSNGDELFIDSKKDCILYNKFPILKIGDDMMYALIYYLRYKYKTCYFEFNDKSSDKNVGNLPVYYLAFTQKPWYEKFGAYLKDEIDKKIYDKTKLNFYTNDFKNNNRLNFEGLLKTDKSKENILKIYDNSETIKNFFDKIKDKIENKEIDFKGMVLPWLEDFIKDIMGFKFMFNMNVKWVIDCSIEVPKKDMYILKKLENNPFPKFKNKYMNIKKKEFYEKQYGGMKTLLPREKELYKDPRWIGWKKYDLSEFHPKDQKYLKKLLNEFPDECILIENN
jgi:hypothetical protein